MNREDCSKPQIRRKEIPNFRGGNGKGSVAKAFCVTEGRVLNEKGRWAGDAACLV